VSQSSKFCRRNPSRCFPTSVYCCCLFRYDPVRELLDMSDEEEEKLQICSNGNISHFVIFLLPTAADASPILWAGSAAAMTSLLRQPPEMFNLSAHSGITRKTCFSTGFITTNLTYKIGKLCNYHSGGPYSCSWLVTDWQYITVQSLGL
jgi:hypothetical protein